MTRTEQKAHFESVVEEIRKIQLSKGGDYANEDRLSNFKLAGSICGLTAEQNCLSLIATKVARLGVLLSGYAHPNNESVDDSIIDLISYGILLHMLKGEIRQEKIEKLPWE